MKRHHLWLTIGLLGFVAGISQANVVLAGGSSRVDTVGGVQVGSRKDILPGGNGWTAYLYSSTNNGVYISII